MHILYSSMVVLLFFALPLIVFSFFVKLCFQFLFALLPVIRILTPCALCLKSFVDTSLSNCGSPTFFVDVPKYFEVYFWLQKFFVKLIFFFFPFLCFLFYLNFFCQLRCFHEIILGIKCCLITHTKSKVEMLRTKLKCETAVKLFY